LSRALAYRGHEVEVFHRVADPSRAEYSVERAAVDGLPVIRVNNTFRDCDRFEKTYRNDAIDRIFGGLLDERRPDVVHFHHVTCLSTNLIAEVHRRGIPIVYTLHDYWLICQRGQFLKTDLSLCPGQEDRECVKCLSWQLGLNRGQTRASGALRSAFPALGSPAGARVKRALKSAYGFYARAFVAGEREARARVRARMDHVQEMCRQVDLFTAPSRFLLGKFVEFGVPAEKIRYSTYGFDVTFYGTPRRPPDGSIRFGYLGTWIPPKGLHLLIEAFNGIDDPRAHLHLYGHAVQYEGYEDYEDQLRGLIRSPRIHLEGYYENRKVGEILASLDVLVVPSIWYENSPLTIQEAFLAGIPVITSDLGGMAELIRGAGDGTTFKARDPEALRTALRRYLTATPARPPAPDGARVKTLEACADEHERIYLSLSSSQVRRTPGGKGGMDA
jgi:glycosyltransferase involved in cell wall biosynthesis